jgi:hypothetical protein
MSATARLAAACTALAGAAALAIFGTPSGEPIADPRRQ